MPGADRPALLRVSRLLMRKAKRLVEFVVYGLFDGLALIGCTRQADARTIAIVHLELLGDYVLWLPYGRAMARHFQRRHHRVVLVLNAAVLPLAKRHFSDCELIGIDRAAFVRNLAIRMQALRRMRQLGAGVTYHATYPRDGIVEDAAVRALGAPAWGFDATFADRPRLDQWMSRRFYIRLLPPMPGGHQSGRHQAFLHAIGIAEGTIEPSADFAAGLPVPDSRPYFVIAPGASRSERCWPIQHFVAAVRQILAACPGWQCVVIGTRGERGLGEVIAEALGLRVINLTGETDIIGMVAWIAHARLVIGNDSAACHIAGVCGVRSVAIVGGGHYGRCFPYDPDEARIQVLPVTVSEMMECFGCDWICRYRVEKKSPYPCIATISPERVCAEAEKLLSGQEVVTTGSKPNASPAKSS